MDLLSILVNLSCYQSPIEQKGQPLDEITESMVNIKDPLHPDSQFWIDKYEYPNESGVKPQAYTSLSQAIEMCDESGKRLCTAYEWRRSCLGKDNNRYSYGENFQRDRCHTAGRLPSGHSSLMDPAELIIESGSRSGCRSDEGVYDMVGNLEEWVLDDWRGANGMLEGGAWYTHTSYADCSGRYSRQPDYRIPTDRRVFSAGFRCCISDTEPTQANLTEAAQQFTDTSLKEYRSLPYQSENEIELAPNHFIDRFEYPNIKGEIPLSVSSWYEANSTCQKYGKRLCDAYEWEMACNGNTGWQYPYGNKFIPSACSVEETTRSESGKFIGCTSPSGPQDMVGSVWEWTATPLNAPVLRVEGSKEQWYELRGGSWFSDSKKATCLPDDGYPAAPSSFLFPEVGFRCCRGDVNLEDLTEQKSTIDCPSDMVGIDDYCIDRYEFPNRVDTPPLMDLSYVSAQQSCEDIGKHLCLADEWLKACGGTHFRRWPYGNTYDVEACHDLGSQTHEGGGGVVPSGETVNCCTPEGVCDMSGNLWEWTSTRNEGTVGVLRGGGWNLSAGLGQCRSKAEAKPDYHAGETGARCCANQTEASLLRENK